MPKRGVQHDDLSTRDRIIEAASTLFATYGYNGASMRDIAEVTGIRVSGLYNHFESKEAVLFEFLRDATAELYELLEGSQEGVCERRECRLMAWVMAQVRFDLQNTKATIVSNHEFRHMTSPFREELAKDRDQIEALLVGILAPSPADRKAYVKSLEGRLLINAVTSISRGIAEWYDVAGRWTVEEFSQAQALLALRLTGSSELPSKHADCEVGLFVGKRQSALSRR